MENSQDETVEIPKVSLKSKPTNKLIYIIIILLLIAAGTGAYMWRAKQASDQKKTDTATIVSLQKQIAELKKADTKPATESTNQATTETSAAPATTVKENIIASIKSGNTAALETYMASSVHVVYAASSGVFDHTPAQAVADLAYLDSATDPWDFGLSAAVLASYEAGYYKDYFESNSVVGKSADGKMVVFNFNTAGKINAVFMAASAELL